MSIPSSIDNTSSNTAESLIFFEVTDEAVSLYKPVQLDGTLFVKQKHREAISTAKIAQMQSLGTPDTEGSEVFYMQACFMEDYADDYNTLSPFEAYKPTYNDMTVSQLRTYFTWRSDVRRGIMRETYISYVYVHFFELLHNIGTEAGMPALEKIVALWRVYRRQYPRIDAHLTEWIKDYYICNMINDSFQTVIEKLNITQYMPLSMVASDDKQQEGLIHALLCCSTYITDKITSISESLQNDIRHCFMALIHNMESLFNQYGITLVTLLAGQRDDVQKKNLFQDAVYYQAKAIEDIVVTISEIEEYTCIQGQWTQYGYHYGNAACVSFTRYLLSRIENMLRTHEKQQQTALFAQTLPYATFSFGYGSASYLPLLETMVRDADFFTILDTTVKCYIMHRNKDAAECQRQCCLLPEIQLYKKRFASYPYTIFKELRRLANVNRTSLDDSEQFYRHVKLFARISLTDAPCVPFDCFMPTYMKMTDAQLCFYFSWRIQIHNGTFIEVPQSYINLYLFELIHMDEIQTPMQTMERMVHILKHTKEHHVLISQWIKDYYICNDFDCSFDTLIIQHGIQAYYPKLCIASLSSTDIFTFYDRISQYRISESRFYSDKTNKLILECVAFVIADITTFFEEHDLSFIKLILGPLPQPSWKPFAHAVYYQAVAVAHKTVCIGETEKYTCVDGKWKCLLVAPSENRAGSHLIGYILKCIEMNIRQLSAYHHKLSSKVDSLVALLYKDISRYYEVIRILKNNTCANRIASGVTQFFQNPQTVFEKPPELTINIDKLAQIRSNSLDVQEKLFIPDDIQYNMLTRQEDIRETSSQTAEIFTTDNMWKDFYASLQPIHQSILMQLATGMHTREEMDTHSAQKEGILLEVLLEQVNECALEYIGDNIIETSGDSIYIYEEYKSNIDALI